MRTDFVKYLHSPLTKEPLSCEIFEGTTERGHERVLQGRLYAENEEYPIIDGVPRILEPSLLTSVLEQHTPFTSRFAERFKMLKMNIGSVTSDQTIERRSQKSFGYQWNEFSEFYLEAWQENYWMYIGKNLTEHDLQGKNVLDIGCGFGRHLYFTAKYGAELAVGVDLSHAVEAAAKNLKAFDNVLIIQANVHALPLAADFDTAYTIGVLQHVTEPGAAIARIVERLKTGGKFFAWVYGPRPWSYHLVVDSLRTFTTRLSTSQLYYLSFFLTLPSYLLFVLPRKILEWCGASRIAAKIPFSHYAKYPFRVSHTDWFDRLGAPKTEYFSEERCLNFLTESKLVDISVKPRSGGGWLLGGVRR